MQHTLLLGTNFLQASSFYHTLGTFGPNPPAFSQRFVRVEEAALGVSFNTQSQAPDILGISSRSDFSQYSASLQVQSKVPDIHLLSLRASTEELLTSFNSQDQSPDDPYSQDRQCTPCDFVKNPLHCSQVLSRLPVRVSTKSCQMSFDLLSSSLHFPVRTSPASPQASSRKEFDVNWEGVSTTHDGVNWTPSTGSLARLLNQALPHPGFSRSEFHVLCLRIRLDSQSVVCVHSVGLGSSWTFLVIFLNDSRGFTLFISLYISFA